MSKGRAQKNLNERTHLIQSQLTSRHKKLSQPIEAAKKGSLDLESLKQLKIELEKPVRLSETLSIQIEDCHPSTGKYKRALPKGYQSDITAVNKAITRAQKSIQAEPIEEQQPNLEGMKADIQARKREIAHSFNVKAKDGIQKIKDICQEHNIKEVGKQIADFFHDEHRNLDLEAIGDYLSGPDAENKEALQAFTARINLAGQKFLPALRSYLKTFLLPKESQKIERLLESFSEAYCMQNPQGHLADKTAGYVLTMQAMFMATTFHNPNAAQFKMDFKKVKDILKGANSGADYDENFLQEIYNDIKATPFELNFVKASPGYEFNSPTLDHDSTFNKLDLLLQSPAKAQVIFPGIGEHVKATADQPKSWLSTLTGYQGTITLTNENTQEILATLQVYSPSVISKWIFGDTHRVIIQPVSQNGLVAQANIDLAAKIAARFELPVTHVKATYHYLEEDLQAAYGKEKALIPPTNSSKNRHSWWSFTAEKSEAQQPEKNMSLGSNS